MCEGTTDYTNHLLECILDRLESDEYESGAIYTVGGPPGTYQLHSPYNTECEYLVIGAALAAISGNGMVVVSNNNPGLQLALGQTFGAATQGSDNTAFEGVALPTGTQVTPTMAIDHWQPLARGGNLYIYVTTTASYAYIALRRKLERYIPEMPRMYPQTHSQPQSRRAVRSLPAQSPMVAGFESQYPDLRREKSGYVHESALYNEDTRNIGNVIKRVQRYGR